MIYLDSARMTENGYLPAMVARRFSNNKPEVIGMPKTTIYPPGDKIQKAIREFSELLGENPDTERWKLLETVVKRFDLSPKECDFLERHFKR